MLFRIVVRVRTVQLSLLLFELELHLLNIILHVFRLEVIAFKFRLNLALTTALLFKLLSIVHERLIFLKFE